MNISTMSEENLKRFGEFESFYYEGRWITNVETHQAANRLGNLLRDLGVKKGDRVVTQLLNCPEIIASFPAINRIGGAIVPLSPLLRPDQASYVFRDCGAKVIITSSLFLDAVRKAKENAPKLQHIILVDQDDVPDTVSYRKRVAEFPSEIDTVETDNEDTAALIYTAGTTGKPKGVIHTHFSIYINALALYEFLLVSRQRTLTQTISEIDPKSLRRVEEKVVVSGLDRARTVLFVLPLSHSYGISVMYVGALTGDKAVVFPRWDVVKALQAIEAFRIESMSFVPTMYIQMLNHPDFDRFNLSSLRHCSCGAAPLPLEIARQWEQRVGVAIREGWGMTETGATTCTQPFDRPQKYGSIGKSIYKCNTVKIFDEQEREAAAYETGEIVVKGPTVMKGYWNKPDETEQTLKNGWLYTGDVGYKDEDGYIFITDRKKDIIIRGGENVSPREVEEVLYQHPKIAEAGVIGIKDAVFGEEIKAFIVLKAGQTVETDEIMEFCKERLPSFKRPKVIQVLDALPRSPVGKVLRYELRKIG
ncbi:MAG: AMP-binding protein [Deltaproteobacteria bacterium]|nr:AMP-binding protein [Deltaproteobacteria bacterium]